MTPGACQCVPTWTGELHQWSCLKAGQRRVPDCICGHAKDDHVAYPHKTGECTRSPCPCRSFAVWGR